MPSRRVPKDWLECPRLGHVIANKFLPFKTPLDSRYNTSIPLSKRFNLETLFSHTNSLEGRLKLVIDLTNTNRYYSPNDIRNHGVAYVKLSCKGHNEAPNPDQIRTFIANCNTVLSTPNDDPSKPFIIGIHCTHGFNRTGFLICAYLVEVEGWNLANALSSFAAARSPGIYKQGHIDKLVERYNEGNKAGSGFVAPSKPAWGSEYFQPTPVAAEGKQGQDKEALGDLQRRFDGLEVRLTAEVKEDTNP